MLGVMSLSIYHKTGTALPRDTHGIACFTKVTGHIDVQLSSALVTQLSPAQLSSAQPWWLCSARVKYAQLTRLTSKVSEWYGE